MATEAENNLRLEIGHVLFIDIVGYSKLLINEQSEQIQTLRKIVRGTEQFRLAEAEGKLVRLPTGDGAALVFRTNVEAPALCALEISKELKNHSDLHVRMGIHSGPVNEVVDLNEQANIAGAGINIAQRVMDCGDAGHILVSKRVADDLEHYSQWRSLLHELGECEVKHGLRISLLNLYGDEAGNPELPEKCRQAKAKGQTAPGAAPAKSVAVLPFVNMSADKHDEYLSDGMTEELINALAKVPGLRVPGRYEFGKYSEAGWTSSIRYYEQGLKLDPNYALAYCGLADTYAYMGGVVMPSKEAVVKEKEFAERALQLDPELAEAHLSLAAALGGAFDWRNAQVEFDRANELNPNLAWAYEIYAWYLGGAGRLDEAIAKDKKAIELDPLNSFFQAALAYFLYHARRYDDAIVQIKRTLELDPASTLARHLLGCRLLWKGDTAGAIAEFQRSKIVVTGAWYQGLLGYAYAISGDRPKAEQMLRELEEMAKRQYVNSTAFADIHLGLGEKEKALDWLDKSYQDQESACWYLTVDPIYDSLRNEPRFQSLIQKVFRETQ